MTRKIRRIALIAPAIQDYCVEYANAISSTCHVAMFCPAAHFSAQASFIDPSVDLRLLDWPRHRSLRNLRFVFALARMIHDFRPDVVHFLSEGVLWLNALLVSLRRYPIVTTVHDISYHPGDLASQRIPRWSINLLISRSDLIVVHGAALRRQAERTYSRQGKRIETLPHRPITKYRKISESLSLTRQSSSDVTILFFGRIYKYKGLSVLIDSSADVVNEVPNVRFVVAGTGEDIQQYKQQVTVPGHFVWLNRFLADEEAAQLFTNADIIVLPYIEASQSGVLAIAQAFEKAVVVTDVGELGRSVQHGISGLVVPSGEPKALARALIDLSLDGEKRRRFGQACGQIETAELGGKSFSSKAAHIYDAVCA